MQAFSLVELLVVITIIAMLAGLLAAALAGAKARAHALVCQNNLRQLTVAWTVYASDNNDHLVYNLGGGGAKKSPFTTFDHNWVNNVMDWELSPDNTNTAFLRTSLLAPYSGNSVETYRCPADYVLSDVQKQAGWSRRVRSVAMNAMTGDAGESSPGGTNVFNPEYRQFLRLSDIPSSTHIFVFLDEHPDSISDGYFLNQVENKEWIHLPASYHQGAGNFSFADGHVEGHRWRLALTKPPAKPDAAPLPSAVGPGQAADFSWVVYRMTVER